MIIGKYRLEGGGECPEQYDVFDGEKMVGYMRLRHGYFRVDLADGTPVYGAFSHSDGSFHENERESYLTAGVQAIEKAISNQGEVL